jgi:hypothetical protein
MLNDFSIVSGKVQFLGQGTKSSTKRTTKTKHDFNPQVSREVAGKIAENLSGFRQDLKPIITNGDMKYVSAALSRKNGVKYSDNTLIRLGDLRKAMRNSPAQNTNMGYTTDELPSNVIPFE